MGRLFKKVVRDLFQDKIRTIIILIAIAIGLLSFGTAMFSYSIIYREITSLFSSTNPASATVVVNKVDDRIIQLTKDFDGIVDFEEKAVYQFRIQSGVNEWKTVYLFAARDFSKTNLNKISRIDGAIQPGINEALIERDAISVANAGLQDNITIQLSDGSQKELKITGVVNDIIVHPASMHNDVYLYVSYDTLAGLGLPVNKIDFVTSGDKYDRQSILTTSNEYMNILEENGYTVKNLKVSMKPGVSEMLDEFAGPLFILQVFSIVTFICGCMIMGGLLSSILSGQIKQIGILKAIGARSKQIFWSHILVLIALMIIVLATALPLAIIISGKLSVFAMSIGNMQPASTSVPVGLYLLFLTLGLIVPICITVFSIRRAIKITVKKALNNYGIDCSKTDSGKLPVEKFLSRPITLSLRNATRRKARFFLNIATLCCGGSLFVAIVVSMISMQSTISNNLNSFKYDYSILITVVSWLLSVIIGIPLGILGVYIFGELIIKTPLELNFFSFILSYTIWLVLSFTVGYLASRISAKRAANMSIKNTLAME